MMNTNKTPGKVQCFHCQEMHEATYSHDSLFAPEPLFAVICTVDNLTDYYTNEVVIRDEATMKDKMVNLSHEVKAHAEENYERDGWDVIVECWSAQEIEEVLWGNRAYGTGPVRSLNGAIKRIGEIAKMVDDNRGDVMATAF